MTLGWHVITVVAVSTVTDITLEWHVIATLQLRYNTHNVTVDSWMTCHHHIDSAASIIDYARMTCQCNFVPLKPNTHRRRRRDETVESRRVGGVYMNSRWLPTDSAMRTHNAAVWVTTADGCVQTDDTTKLSPTSCEFVYTPPTWRDSTVSSLRRCVLGLRHIRL